MDKRTVNGREIEYGDAIHHTTTTQFKLWDRIKILFGKKVIITSIIYTREVANTLGSEATTSVERIFPYKSKKGFGFVHTPDDIIASA